jgi:hypothetical protein
MRRLAVALLIGCSSTAAPPPQRPPVVTAQPTQPAQPPLPPPRCAVIDGDDALALAGPTDATHAIDLDGDPATTESAVEHDCRSGLRCHYAIYAQRDGCWTRLGATGDLMSEPGCERGSPKGTYCTLTGMRLMIHGDAQQYIYPFRGAYGAEEAGPRYVPGPSKRP